MLYKKAIFIFIIISNLFSTFYLLALGNYNNLLVDDYLFASELREEGFIKFIIDMYLNWQGRFGSFFISSVFYKTVSNNMIILTVLHLLVAYTGVFLLLKLLLKKDFWIQLSLSILLINSALLGLFEISTFYWLCGSSYIMLISLTFILIWSIFNRKLSNWLSYPIIITLSIIIGGGAESYTPLLILILGIYMIFQFIKSPNLYFKDSVNIRLFITLILLSIFLIIMIIAPGNKARLDYVENELHFSHPTGIALFLKTCRAMINFLYLLVSKLHFYILVIPAFIWIGSQSGHLATNKLFTGKNHTLRYFILSVIGLLLFFWISLLPGVYAMNDLMPLRSLSYVSFVMIVFFSYWGLYWGIHYHYSKIKNVLIISSLIIITSLTTFRIINDIPKAKTYNKNIKTIEAKLLELQQNKFKGIAYVN